MEQEQRQAEVFRSLYRLNLINYEDLNNIANKLQIRLFNRRWKGV